MSDLNLKINVILNRIEILVNKLSDDGLLLIDDIDKINGDIDSNLKQIDNLKEQIIFSKYLKILHKEIKKWI